MKFKHYQERQKINFFQKDLKMQMQKMKIKKKMEIKPKVRVNMNNSIIKDYLLRE